MSQLLPYETIVKASEGDPEAVAAVLSHYAGFRSRKRLSVPGTTWIYSPATLPPTARMPKSC